jgi:acyl-CoA reductase-like NAD-dependent aldehyde dehydrogenase
VIIGGGDVGKQLLSFKFDGIFFTGSHATGLKIAESAARQLTKVQLELGGKDPVYVCEDMDPGFAAEALADGAFYNCGQSCCSVERIYVHEKVYETFLEHFKKTVEAFSLGDPKDSNTYLGPLARQGQLAVLEDQIKDALAKGAKILCGGARIAGKAGHYFMPTVLMDVDHSMAVMREESFGPVIGIQKVSGDEKALELMNDTSYGLTAGVYTRDEKRAKNLMAQLDTGSVYWNCCDRVSPRLPWSGRKNSGLGLTLGAEGILTFTQPKAWHLRSPAFSS